MRELLDKLKGIPDKLRAIAKIAALVTVIFEVLSFAADKIDAALNDTPRKPDEK